MQIFIFIFYLSLSILFFSYYGIEKNTGLSIKVIIALFTIKVLCGCINLYVHFYSVVTNDVGFFFWQSINELKAMHNNPKHFFYEWLVNWGDIRVGFDLSSPLCNVFWKDLGILVHSKFMTLANILSLGNQYVNVIIYNIPFFLGQLLLYKSFYQIQPHKKGLMVLSIFLVPSVLFWCSGIHKDGWVLAAFGVIIYSMSKFAVQKNRKYLLSLAFGLFFLFIVRYFYMVTLLPLLIMWFCVQNRKHKTRYYLGALLLSLLLFFNIQKIIPDINPMKLIQSRQAEFFGKIGYSDIRTPILENDFYSYFRNLPTAINHIFLQPPFSTSSPIKYQISSIDNYFTLIIMLILTLFIKRKNLSNAMYLSLLLYALSIYLFIGYTIPNCGALVRYKSEFTALLLASLVGLSEFPKCNDYLNRKLFGAK